MPLVNSRRCHYHKSVDRSSYLLSCASGFTIRVGQELHTVRELLHQHLALMVHISCAQHVEIPQLYSIQLCTSKKHGTKEN